MSATKKSTPTRTLSRKDLLNKCFAEDTKEINYFIFKEKEQNKKNKKAEDVEEEKEELPLTRNFSQVIFEEKYITALQRKFSESDLSRSTENNGATGNQSSSDKKTPIQLIKNPKKNGKFISQSADFGFSYEDVTGSPKVKSSGSLRDALDKSYEENYFSAVEQELNSSPSSSIKSNGKISGKSSPIVQYSLSQLS